MKIVIVGEGKCYVTLRNKKGYYGLMICPIENGDYKRGETVAEEDLGEPELTILFDRKSVKTLIKALADLIWGEHE